MTAALQKEKQISTIAMLFCAMLLFKFATDLGYWKILILDTVTYRADFNALKYAVGLIWCVVLFLPIRHLERKVSTFFLYMVYLLQIIPITTIYSLGNDSSAYYNVLCGSFLLCELLVGYTRSTMWFQRNAFVSKVMLWGFFGAILLLMVVVVIKNGAPSLIALDIYKVYELRTSGDFQLGKYMNYILTWSTKVFLPLFLAKSLADRKYGLSCLLCGTIFLLYLYTGHKTFLFSIPLVVVSSFWARRKNFYKELFLCACIGFAVLVLLACFSPVLDVLWDRVYSLFGRRVMIGSANNKFKYFDYFTNYPKLGISGVFPRWLINIPNPLSEYPIYTHHIAEIYYGKPEMGANTGFFAEGFMRFGHTGTVGIMMLFGGILKQVDRLQERIGYALTIGIFVYPIFTLADGHLMDSLVLGPWMFSMLILFFYQENVRSKRERAILIEGHCALYKSIVCLRRKRPDE